MPKVYLQTLCWDCKKATGGCSWSDYTTRTPVIGWTAKLTRLKAKGELTDSFIVLDCPEFERDAIAFGTKRLQKEGIA